MADLNRRAPSDDPGSIAPTSVAGRVVQGAFWVLALRGLGRVATTVRTLVLVRLLTPHDFGLVGVALAVVACAEALSVTGVALALVSGRRDDRDAFDTAWTIGIIRGALVSAVLMLLAPTLATFFGSPEATNLIRLMSLAPLIDGFNNIGVIEFRRDLTYGPHYVLQAAGEFADLFVAVPLAWWMGSAWALAWSWIALWVVRVLVSYVIHPYRPRLRIVRAEVPTLLRFAGHVTGASALTWLTTGGVDALVGRVLGIEALGLFRMAKLVALLLPTEVAGVLSWVSVAAFARVDAVGDHLRRTFAELWRVTLAVALPFSAGTALFATSFVPAILGERWTAIVPAVQVLAVVALLRAMISVTNAAFQGRGRPKYQMYASVAELAVLLVAFVPLSNATGLAGAASAVALGALAALIATVPPLRSMRAFAAPDALAAIGFAGAAAAPMVVIRIVTGGGPLATSTLVGVIAMCAAGYVAAWMVMERAALAPATIGPVLASIARRRTASST